ncbi:hypothetical protein MCEMAEM4_03314 [Burkholderiaceae bacterium]
MHTVKELQAQYLSTHYAFNDFETTAFEAVSKVDRATATRREIFDKGHRFKSELKL